jgi:hypothetical protein
MAGGFLPVVEARLEGCLSAWRPPNQIVESLKTTIYKRESQSQFFEAGR